MVRLGEVVEKVASWNPSKSAPASNFTYVDLSSIELSAKTVTSPQSCRGSDAPSRARQLLAAGDILVSTVRPNLNAVAQISGELDGATGSTGFSVLRATPGRVDSRYLFHWVQSPDFVSTMVRRATGASYPAVSDRIVKESSLPLPTIFEQRRIAKILDHAAGLRAKHRGALAYLEELAQSIFIEMFGDPAVNPMKWPVAELSALVRPEDKINYGVVQPGAEVDGGVPLVRAGDIANGSVKTDGLRSIASDVDVRHRRSRLVGDEILVSCVGSIGEVALTSPAMSGYNIARAVARIRVGTSAVREYVAASLSTASVRNYFNQELRTVAQPTLNIKQLAATEIMVPPIRLQQDFALRVGSLESTKTKHRIVLSELDALFESLQSRAFRGGL